MFFLYEYVKEGVFYEFWFKLIVWVNGCGYEFVFGYLIFRLVEYVVVKVVLDFF